jgi:hypothetical protein
MSPATDWKENIAPDEPERFARLAERLAAVQKSRPGVATRGLHAKCHAGLRARFRVLPDLPAEARVGLFAEPRERRAYVRLSNGHGVAQPDKVPDFRGLAVKVLDVDGPKVLGDARTQDLLALDIPTVPFRSPDEFVTFVCATADRKGAFGRLFRELGVWRAIVLLVGLARTAKGGRRSLLDLPYYGVAPIAFGPHAARFAFFPLAPGDEPAPDEADPDYLGVRARARVAKRAPIEFELRAQFYSGPETPIEDSTVQWPAPYVAIARLAIDRQDPSTDGGKRLHDYVERLSFDPWHALTAHRPLGAIMRARKPAYFESIKVRGAIAEPDGTEWDSFA